MLAKHIKSVGLEMRKISIFIYPLKDSLELRTPGVYSIPYECGQVYIGETVQSIETRMKEHHRHVRLGDVDRLVVAEYSFNHLTITIS